jgi:fermentation-respiration switch protein FrsA (DUF1100 family)
MPNFNGRTKETRNVKYNEVGFRSPDDVDLPYDDVYIKTKDNVTIHAWLLKQPENYQQCPTIIYFHGNAGNIGFRLHNARTLYQRTECNILMVEYRGYGNSGGTPSELGLNLDATAALSYLQERTDISANLFVFGRSLGGSVAVMLASRHRESINGMLLENTFTSLLDVVLVLLTRLKVTKGHRFFRFILPFILTSHLDSQRALVGLRTPILFISGEMDELIPKEHMTSLYTASHTHSRDCSIHRVPNGTHNDTFLKGGDLYYSVIQNFIKRNTARIS